MNWHSKLNESLLFRFLLICVVASAYLEGDRIITCAMRQSKVAPPTSVFNLNNLTNEREVVGTTEDNASKESVKVAYINGTVETSNQ